MNNLLIFDTQLACALDEPNARRGKWLDYRRENDELVIAQIEQDEVIDMERLLSDSFEQVA
jgi:hypothetical protein